MCKDKNVNEVAKNFSYVFKMKIKEIEHKCETKLLKTTMAKEMVNMYIPKAKDEKVKKIIDELIAAEKARGYDGIKELKILKWQKMGWSM